jgi:DNA-binding beta-propeller fold protein YncE
VKGVTGVPSHLALDRELGLLYIADTGHSRIVVLDINTGSLSGAIYPNFDGSDQRSVAGATLETLVDGAETGLQAPSGIALVGDDMLFVTDNATSTVYAFSTVTGEVIDWLDTGLPAGSLRGIEFDSQGNMYLIDGLANRVLRYSVP